MVGSIGAKRLDEDVHIWKDHGRFIRSSRSLVRLRSTPGKVPPDAREMGNGACT